MPGQSQAREFTEPRGVLALWTGILAGPIVTLLHQEVSFILVPFACAWGWQLVMHAVTLVALALIAGAGWLSWRKWKEAGPRWPGDGNDSVSRGRFMAAGGVLLSGLFFLLVLAQGIATVVLNACD